jgi:hypothetical protein
MNRPLKNHPFRSAASGLALGLVVAFTAVPALAGEVKIGEGITSLEVDDNGKLTADGRKTALSELDKLPGEDAWDANIHATLDSGRGDGPLYVEFWHKVQGEWQSFWRHDMNDYDGRKYVIVNILLEGNYGFNKDREYTVKFVQVNTKGNDITLAKGNIKLINTGRKVEESEDGGGGGGAEGGDDEPSAQDIRDTLVGDDDEEGEAPDAPAPEPPPAEPSKKGCSIGGEWDAGFSGLAVLLLAGIANRRRRD